MFQLGNRADPDAYEAKKLMTLMRSVKENVFVDIVGSLNATVEQFIKEATNVDCAIKARASHYQRLPGVAASSSSSSYLGPSTSDIVEIIPDAVRKELRKLLSPVERPASLSVAEIVRDEVQRALRPEDPANVAALEVPTMTYAPMTRRLPPVARQ